MTLIRKLPHWIIFGESYPAIQKYSQMTPPLWVFVNSVLRSENPSALSTTSTLDPAPVPTPDGTSSSIDEPRRLALAITLPVGIVLLILIFVFYRYKRRSRAPPDPSRSATWQEDLRPFIIPPALESYRKGDQPDQPRTTHTSAAQTVSPAMDPFASPEGAPIDPFASPERTVRSLPPPYEEDDSLARRVP